MLALLARDGLAQRLFFQAAQALAARELGHHVGRAQAEMRQRDHAVKPEVGDLADQRLGVALAVLPGLGGHDGLAGLLGDLLEEGVGALVQQARDIALLGVAAIGGLARFDHRRQAVQGVGGVAHL